MKNNKLVIAIVLLFVLIRLVGLGTDISNSDAARWHRRADQYFKALVNGTFNDTLPTHHPGITLIWIGKISEIPLKLFPQSNPVDAYILIHTTSKWFLAGILAFLLLVQMWAITKLFSKNTAWWYGFIISVEPYMIGINRWFHLTSIEVFFGFTSVLLILLWRKKQNNILIVFSSLFFILSLVTKITSLILIPIFIIVFLNDYLKRKKIHELAIFIGTSFCLLSLFMPVLLINPSYTVQKLFLGIQTAVSEDVRVQWLPVVLIPFYYLMILAFKLTPISLMLFPISLWYLRKKQNLEIIVLCSWIVFYYFALSVSVQKIDRYSLVFIPAMALIISFSVSSWKRIFQITLVLLYLMFLGYVTYVYFPVYSAYYSPVFGGTKNSLNLGLYDNSGEYFAQAAAFLNSKGSDKYTFIPDNIESFSVFYRGHSQRTFDGRTNYILRSLDTERKSFATQYCNQLEKSFGPPDIKVVNVYFCK